MEVELGHRSSAIADQDWSWAHTEPEPEVPQVDAEQVAVVLVVHQAEDWLPRTLVALGRLDQRPGFVVAVDNGSTDGSAAVLAKAANEELVDLVLTGEPTDTFGRAVERARAELPAHITWLWLWHDDAEPRRTALTELLLRAGREPRAEVLVPALMAPRMRNHPDRVLEAGRTLTPAGRRTGPADTGDIDQNQLDSVPVLGGSTAGMFVEVAAFDQLGGFDPDVPVFHDGVDFGWRAHEAGLRVVSAPRAVLYHRQMGRHGERASTLVADPVATERRLGMRVVAAHARRPRLRRWVMALAGFFAGLGLLLGKAPRAAVAEWRASAGLLTDGAVVRRMVARRQASHPVSPALLPTRRDGLVGLVDRVGTAFTERYHDYREDHPDLDLDELTGDDYSGHRTRTRFVSPSAALSTLMVVLALIASRRFWGPGQLVGPALHPAPDTLAQAFRGWWGVPAAPWQGWAALGATLSLGRPELLARLVVLGAPVLAAWSFLGLARWALGRQARGWIAPTVAAWYGAGLVVLGVSAQGSLATSLLAVVAPRIVLATARWFTGDDSRSRTEQLRAPAALAAWTALAATAHPVLALLAPVVALAHLVVRRPNWSQALVAAAPAAVLAGWWPTLWREPARLLTDAEPLRAAAVTTFTRWQPSWPVAAMALVALLLALVLAALRLREGRVVPAVTLALALVFVAAAVALPRQAMLLDALPVRPAGAPWLVWAWLAVMTALLVARPRAVLGWVMALGFAVSAVLWVEGASTRDLQVDHTQLPAHVTAAHRASGARTLMITQTDREVRWSVVAADQPVWGAGERNPAGDPARSAEVAPLVQQVAAGSPSPDLATRLANLGFSHVWLRGASVAQKAAVTNVAGLTPGVVDDRTMVWTVRDPQPTPPPVSHRGWGWALWPPVALLALAVLAAPTVGAAPMAAPRRAREDS